MTLNPTTSAPLIIQREDPAQPDVIVMLRHGEAESARLYPADSNHHLGLEDLRQPEVCFLVARDVNGNALGTGAVVLRGDWAEIKRMWVEESARGQGISHKILEALITAARGASVEVIRLETGVESHAALALYEKAGFERRGPFADYRSDPLSVFMERLL
jgi:putative acetyltransferase